MAEEELDPARKQRAYLEQWIQRDDRQRALRPTVVRMLGTSVWQEESMDALRCVSPHMAREVDGDIWRSLTTLKEVLPLPVSYDDTTILSSTAVAVTSSANIFEALVSVQGTEPAPALHKQVTRYEELVAEQGREAETASRVAALFPDLAPRFAEVQDAVHAARGNELEEERAAIAMRTFIQKLKGELFEKARAHLGENMTWALMADRIGHGGGQQVLLQQEAAHSSVNATLSNIGKGRKFVYTFNQATTRFIDHVFAVCGDVLAGQASR